jgi:hypothetical protein
MILFSRPFFRRLRHSCLVVLRQNKAAYQEYRRRRFRPKLLGEYWRYLFFVMVVFFVLMAKTLNGQPFTLTAIALYCTATVATRSRILFTNLHWGNELAVFFGCPVEDEWYFRLQWQKFLRRSAWTIIPLWLAFSLVAMYANASWTGFVAALLAATFQWFVIVGLLLLTLRLRHPLMPKIAFALYALILVAAFVPPQFSRSMYLGTLVLPAGWINLGFTRFLAGNYLGIALVVPPLVFAAIGWSRLKGTRDTFSPQFFTADGAVIYTIEDENVGSDSEESTELLTELTFNHNDLSYDPVNFTILAETLNHPLGWKDAGLIERVAGGCLNKEEQTIAEFLLGGVPRKWTLGWKRAFYTTAVTLVAARAVPVIPLWLVSLALFVAAVQAAPLAGIAYQGFKGIRNFTIQTPLLAFYPFSYWKTSAVIFKLNLVRLIAYIALLVPSMLILLPVYQLTWSPVAVLWQTISCLIFLQIGIVVLLHSQGTDDTKRLSLKFVAYFLLVPIVVLSLLIAMIVAFDKGMLIEVSLTLATFLGFVLAWWLYGLMYNGKVDLIVELRQ